MWIERKNPLSSTRYGWVERRLIPFSEPGWMDWKGKEKHRNEFDENEMAQPQDQPKEREKIT